MSEAAGIVLTAKRTGRTLFLLRQDGTWGIAGGMRDPGERLVETMLRELTEETGYDGPVGMRTEKPETFVNGGRQFRYAVYRGFVEDEFEPELDAEHLTHMWSRADAAPEPLHPGVEVALRDLRLR